MPDIVQVTVKTKTLDLFRFMCFHAYSKIAGMVTLVFSIVSLIMLPISILAWQDNFVTAAFALVVIMYLILTPLNMLSQSKRQVLSNPVFKNLITYHISEEVFEVQQYTGTVRLYWTQILKVKKTTWDYLFYVNKEQAFVMPKTSVDPDEILMLEGILDKVKDQVGSKVPIEPEVKKRTNNKKEKVDGLEKQLMELAAKDSEPIEKLEE